MDEKLRAEWIATAEELVESWFGMGFDPAIRPYGTEEGGSDSHLIIEAIKEQLGLDWEGYAEDVIQTINEWHKSK